MNNHKHNDLECGVDDGEHVNNYEKSLHNYENSLHNYENSSHNESSREEGTVKLSQKTMLEIMSEQNHYRFVKSWKHSLLKV